MRKIFVILISIFLLCLTLPTALADSLIRGNTAKDSVEFYTIGNSAHTFAEVYDRMHIYLDLVKYPIPDPQVTMYEYVTGQHDSFTVLKDDDNSYDYIGYVTMPSGDRTFIVWSWSGYHRDGSLIGVETYYTLDGIYLGNVEHDYTSGSVRSSSSSPFFYLSGSLSGKE